MQLRIECRFEYFMLFFVSFLTVFAFLSMLYHFLISKLLYNLAIASLAKGNWLNNKEKRRKIQNQYFNLIHGVCSLLATWQHHQQFGFSHWIIITLFFGAFFSSFEWNIIFTKLKHEKKRPAINCKLQLTRSKSKWENQLNYHAFSLTKNQLSFQIK